MKIKRIGFGYTKSLGNYENCKLWLEADLEDWEDPSESLNLLRDRVAEELSLPDKWFDTKGKFTRQLQALEAVNAALEKSKEHFKKAQEEWGKYEAFLVAHGIDPATLQPKSLEQVAHELDAANDLALFNEDGTEDGDDDYFDPYYGNEYDRIHGNEVEDEPENSYF